MKAFLSHSSRDKPLVEEVAKRLGMAQVELDSSTFDSGLLNVETIRAALERSSIFVLFLTQDALESSYVRFEALLAQELLAKGLLEKFLVICLDAQAFSKADENWKSFSFVRHLTSDQSIARLIQNHLIIDRAKTASKHQPYVEPCLSGYHPHPQHLGAGTHEVMPEMVNHPVAKRQFPL